MRAIQPRPLGRAFPIETFHTVSAYWAFWQRFGVAMRIAVDHEHYEEMLEIYPEGGGREARWHIHRDWKGAFWIEDTAGGSPLRFASIAAALEWIGAEIESEVYARAGEDPCGSFYLTVTRFRVPPDPAPTRPIHSKVRSKGR
jgi:hypothetical protein